MKTVITQNNCLDVLTRHYIGMHLMLTSFNMKTKHQSVYSICCGKCVVKWFICTRITTMLNTFNIYSHEDKAPKCANSIQYVVEKNIQPWMSWSDSSLCSNRNHSRPASIPSATVWTQFSLDSILGRASWKLRCDNTYQKYTAIISPSMTGIIKLESLIWV